MVVISILRNSGEMTIGKTHPTLPLMIFSHQILFKVAVRINEFGSFHKVNQRESELQARMTKRHVDSRELSNMVNFYDSDYYYDFGGLLG